MKVKSTYLCVCANKFKANTWDQNYILHSNFKINHFKVKLTRRDG